MYYGLRDAMDLFRAVVPVARKELLEAGKVYEGRIRRKRLRENCLLHWVSRRADAETVRNEIRGACNVNAFLRHHLNP